MSFLIDLSAWVASRKDILSFITGMAQFLSRSIDVKKLAQAQPVEHFSFLLNGWNEVAESESHYAIKALQDLERTFPAAGIIVATRTHHIAPPVLVQTAKGLGDNGLWHIEKLNGILYLLDVGSKTTSFSSAFAGISLQAELPGSGGDFS